MVAEFRDPIYPGLVSTGKVERGGDRPFHAVINAENFHALQFLLYTHEGKVDAIYIDPPYNTGARDWKYNNDYVDNDDAYRHSKWLAMMERRLKLAKRLLNPESAVLIVTTDENEVHRLSLLLEELFPSKIQMVTALINPAGASIIDQFARVDEHLLFAHIGSARPQRTTAETTPLHREGSTRAHAWESLQRSGGNSRRQDTKAKFFRFTSTKGTGASLVAETICQRRRAVETSRILRTDVYSSGRSRQMVRKPVGSSRPQRSYAISRKGGYALDERKAVEAGGSRS